MKHMFVLVMVLLLGVTSPVFSAEIPVDEIVIIANVDVPVNNFTADEVKAVFTGETGKVGKIRLNITILKKKDIRDLFLKNYIKRTYGQFISDWKKLVFSGKASMPKSFKTEEELVKYIAKTSGAVGYIHVKTSQNSSLMTDKVKVVPIVKK